MQEDCFVVAMETMMSGTGKVAMVYDALQLLGTLVPITMTDICNDC